MTSIPANVMRYWGSATANVKYGGTKKKSKAATLRNDAKIDGPRPNRAAVNTTPSREIMMRLTASNRGNNTEATAVQTVTIITVCPSTSHEMVRGNLMGLLACHF